MPEPSIDPSWIIRIADWISAAILALVGWLYQHFDRRINETRKEMTTMRESIPSIYERAEMDRQRQRVAALFESHGKTREMISEGFSEINENLHEIHTSLLTELNKKADK